MKGKKLRLLVTKECNRNHPYCCNRQYDLDALPECTSYKGFDEILLTGGEPMLRPNLVLQTVADIRAETDAPIYLYTAKLDDVEAAISVLDWIRGMTVTLHDWNDVVFWIRFNERVAPHWRWEKSLRVKIFSGLRPLPIHYPGWKYRFGIEWMEHCPLPEGEVFLRLKKN